jgi:hypothetical protein
VQAVATWQGFYTLVGTAAATLVGLAFVALSLHLSVFTRRHRDLEALAGQAFKLANRALPSSSMVRELAAPAGDGGPRSSQRGRAYWSIGRVRARRASRRGPRSPAFGELAIISR